MLSHRQWPSAALAAGLLVLYVLTAELVYVTLDVANDGVQVFLPAGFTVFALTLSPPRRWPALIAAIVVAEVGLDVHHGYDVALTAGFMAANVAHPLLSASLLRRFAPPATMFSSPRHFVRCLLILVSAGPLASAAIGTFTLALAFGFGLVPSQFPHWYLGDAFGSVIVATALFALTPAVGGRSAAASRRQRFGIVALLLALFASTAVLFHLGSQPLGWVIIPLVLWIALVGGVRDAGFAVAIVTVVAELETIVTSLEKLEDAAARARALGLVQGYMVVVLLCGMLLAVEGRRRQALQAELREQQWEQFNAELLRTRRLEAVGQLAGGLAHDFNNLLGIIRNYAEHLQLDPTLAERSRRDASQIAVAAERGGGLVQRLLGLTDADQPSTEDLDLGALVQSLADVLRSPFTHHEIRVDAAADALVHGDRVQLEQLLLNLVFNAREAMPTGGSIDLVVRAVDPPHEPSSGSSVGAGPAPTVRLEVRDTGHGMPPEVLQRAFEPFFTTKTGGRPAGFGLATVRSIVDAHRGRIALSSRPGVGTTVTVTLPRAEHRPPSTDSLELAGEAVPAPRWGRSDPLAEEKRPPMVAGSAVPLPSGHGRGQGRVVLVVDDDVASRRSVSQLLRGQGYSTVTLPNGRHVIDALAAGTRPDLILSDVVMPEVSGIELADRLRISHPDVPVVLMSGDPGLRDRELPWPLLLKPLDPERLDGVLLSELQR